MRARSLVVVLLVCLCIGILGLAEAGADPAQRDRLSGATASKLVCPSHDNPHGLRFWIHVTRWCGLNAVRGQTQFKLQMEIHNQDRHRSLDISQPRMRLIVRRFNPDRWTPPSPTFERPIKTTWEGKRVWAVPSNFEDAADLIPHHPNIFTFATHWHASRLEPGETFHPHYHYGDLVFYVPKLRHGPDALENVVGMAYVRGHEIIALCDPSDWGPKVPAETF